MSVRTVRYWDAGQCRVPWSVVRLLRIVRLGDLGALDDRWDGWTLNRNGLWAPDGHRFDEHWMRRWWLVSEQARLFRMAYDRGEIRGVGRSPALTLQPEAGKAAQPAAAAQRFPVGAAATLTAFARDAGRAAGAAGAGKVVSLSEGAARSTSAAAARSAAGLVISSTSGTRFAQRLMLQGFARRAHGR